MDRSITVVVFYESHEIREMMDDLLRRRTEKLFFSNLNKDQKEFIKFSHGDHRCFLFIYAFDDPKFAGDLHELISNHEVLSNIQKAPHLSVLFCNREHRERAYEECVEKQFFFYETIRPVYDMNKVRLLLELASDSLKQQMKMKELEAELAEMRNDISEVSFQLDDIEESINDEKGIQGGLLDDITANLNHWEEENSKAENSRATKAPESKDDSGNVLTADFNKFKSHNQGYFSSLGDQVNRAKPKMNKNEPLVIVADDQPMMLKIITTILKPKGFRVETAPNGEEAFNKARRTPPNAVLLDIDMPVMNGLQTLKAFKEQSSLKDIPIIMLTSNSDKSSFVECLELGAKDYIVKPTNADILLKKLLAVI